MAGAGREVCVAELCKAAAAAAAAPTEKVVEFYAFTLRGTLSFLPVITIPRRHANPSITTFSGSFAHEGNSV